jgi:hypothetical protein
LDWTKLKPEFVKVNEVAINGTVRANKKAAMTICGEDAIRVFEDKSPIDKR